MLVETQLAVGDGAAPAERVEISNPDIAAKEDGVRSVQVNDLKNKGGEIVGVGAGEPTWSAGGIDGDVFSVVEHDVAVCVGIGDAVESANVDKASRPVRSMGREEFVEEACSAV